MKNATVTFDSGLDINFDLPEFDEVITAACDEEQQLINFDNDLSLISVDLDLLTARLIEREEKVSKASAGIAEVIREHAANQLTLDNVIAEVEAPTLEDVARGVSVAAYHVSNAVMAVYNFSLLVAAIFGVLVDLHEQFTQQTIKQATLEIADSATAYAIDRVNVFTDTAIKFIDWTQSFDARLMARTAAIDTQRVFDFCFQCYDV